ncbi:MAG: 50S ribosomal protein L6 [Bacteroidia bacterium]
MSRIGKAPVALPEKVEVNLGSNNEIKVKGPKGELIRKFDPDMKFRLEDGTLHVERPTEQKRHKAIHGLTRALIANMVHGVSEGYEIKQELVGVGYKASNTGQLLELSVGYSHDILFQLPDEVKVVTETQKGKSPTIILQSIDKELIGQVAAKIRSFRKPEPYKGKGIRFAGEQIRRKAGKTAGK